MLQTQNGFAGYSLIKQEGDAATLAHAIFDPMSGNEIATVSVKFAAPEPPQPNSRLDILMDLARPAMAGPVVKKPRVASTESKTIELAKN